MSAATRIRDAAEDPAERDRLLTRFRDLLSRAKANRDRLSRVITPDPDLGRMRQILVDGQGSQAAVLSSALEFLETRDPAHLTGPKGVARSDGDEPFHPRVREAADRLSQAHGLLKSQAAPGEEKPAP